MKVYEYDEIIETLYRAASNEEGIDPETGMVFDVSLLDKLEMERDAKIENALLYAEQLKADEKEINDYVKRLSERAKAKKRAADNIKAWLVDRLRETKDGKFETARIRATVSVTAGGKAEITDENAIPEQYRKYEWEPDVTAIKKALQSGEAVAGAKLADTVRLTVK